MYEFKQLACLPALAAPTAAADAESSSEDKDVTLPCASVILQLSVQLHLTNVISNFIRPHRIKDIQTIKIDDSNCMSVCKSVCPEASLCKTAEEMDVLFVVNTLGNPMRRPSVHYFGHLLCTIQTKRFIDEPKLYITCSTLMSECQP